MSFADLQGVLTKTRQKYGRKAKYVADYAVNIAWGKHSFDKKNLLFMIRLRQKGQEHSVMIENVYTDTTTKGAEYEVSGRRPPKNVRQVGFFTGDFRIYIEDYVHTFTHWLAEQDYSTRCVAVLVGEFAKSEHSREVYSYGAVVAENAYVDGKVEMASEIWKQVYETIKEYFPDGEIVGWFYGGTSFTDEEREMFRQVHLDYFAGTDRILMLYDFLEREEEFYRYENDELCKQTGYYIYYEKNSEMQSYMIDKKQGKTVEEKVEDRAVKEVRSRLSVSMQEDREENESSWKPVEGNGQQPGSGPHFLYVAGVVLAAIAVVTGAAMVYNQERLKSFEQTLNQIMGAAENGTPAPTDSPDEKTADNSQNNIFDNDKVKETFQGQEGEKATSTPEIPDSTPTGSSPDDPVASPTPEATIPAAPTPTKEAQDISQTPSDIEEDPKTEEDPEPTLTPIPTEPTEPTNPEPTEIEPEDTVGDKIIDPSQCTVYVVQPGDTLVRICMNRYGNLDNLDLIKELNQLNDKYLIYAYQELLVP